LWIIWNHTDEQPSYQNGDISMHIIITNTTGFVLIETGFGELEDNQWLDNGNYSIMSNPIKFGINLDGVLKFSEEFQYYETVLINLDWIFGAGAPLGDYDLTVQVEEP
ncbi:unnamed protein product, partial [marine sediment metagenome]